MLAIPDFVSNVSWYPGSGATNHITNDLANLNNRVDYTGTNKLHVGNVKCFPIHHIGNSCFQSQNKTFLLKDILHVPNITKNLLSVSHFVKDNPVFIEFHPGFCFVKDRVR